MLHFHNLYKFEFIDVLNCFWAVKSIMYRVILYDELFKPGLESVA